MLSTKPRKTTAANSATAKRFAQAAGEGNLGTVKRLADKHPELVRHWEPLLDAAHEGQVDVVRFLLSRGANANVMAANAHEHRPLHRVIEHRTSHQKTAAHVKVVEALLEGGADVTARGTWLHVTPIALAAMGPQPQFLPPLLAYLDHWDLFHAAVTGQEAHVAMILRREPSMARAMDVNGMTPLHYVAASRLGVNDAQTATQLKRIADMLIEAGTDPNARAQFPHGEPLTPAYFAAGNKSVLQTLLLAGADATDALFPALESDDFEMAALLLHAGADVKTRRCADQVAAFTRFGHYEQAKWLVEHGADANGRTPNDGRTALHWAATRAASAGFVRTLLDHKACPNLHDADGATPLTLAKAKKRDRLADLLEKHGAKE
jgi:ankyrin repeat protein